MNGLISWVKLSKCIVIFGVCLIMFPNSHGMLGAVCDTGFGIERCSKVARKKGIYFRNSGVRTPDVRQVFERVSMNECRRNRSLIIY